MKMMCFNVFFYFLLIIKNHHILTAQETLQRTRRNVGTIRNFFQYMTNENKIHENNDHSYNLKTCFFLLEI